MIDNRPAQGLNRILLPSLLLVIFGDRRDILPLDHIYIFKYIDMISLMRSFDKITKILQKFDIIKKAPCDAFLFRIRFLY